MKLHSNSVLIGICFCRVFPEIEADSWHKNSPSSWTHNQTPNTSLSMSAGFHYGAVQICQHHKRHQLQVGYQMFYEVYTWCYTNLTMVLN